MHTQWQNLNKVKRKKLLKKLFFDVLFHHENLPGFMTEEDWSDLFEFARAEIYSYKNREYVVSLDLETFAYRYWVPESDKFWVLVNFLENNWARVKIGSFDLFQSTDMDNNVMRFYFNMEAVLFWMSQQQ